MNGIFVVLQLILRRQQIVNCVQHIAGAVTVCRGDRKRVADAQIVELIQFHRRFPDRIALVDSQNHRLAAFLEHACHGTVISRHAAANVSHQHDHVRPFDRQFRLPPHLLQNHVIGHRFDTAGIHQHERTVPPFALGIDPVAGHAGGILDDRQPLSDQLIKQRGLSHIGSSYHRYNR